ncbi:MAG: hypothetical protein ABI411_00565 [Tahibacter sp.]
MQPLADYFGDKVFILHCGERAGGYHLCAEPMDGTSLSPNSVVCAEHFLSLLEKLPPDLQRLWWSCTDRAFDYGFDGGLEEPPISITLDTVRLQRMAALGVSVRVTVYPFREPPAGGAESPG